LNLKSCDAYILLTAKKQNKIKNRKKDYLMEVKLSHGFIDFSFLKQFPLLLAHKPTFTYLSQVKTMIK